MYVGCFYFPDWGLGSLCPSTRTPRPPPPAPRSPPGSQAQSQDCLREAAKKVLFLMAGPLRKKDFFCCYLKIKDILLKMTYQNINTGNVGIVVVFYQVCCNFWQKIWLFYPKNSGEEKSCQNLLLSILRLNK